MKREYLSDSELHIVLVWDGDDYANNSFTHIIKSLMEYPYMRNIHYVAVKKTKEISSLVKSWKPIIEKTGENIHVIGAPDNLSWDELGIYGLEKTKANIVICAGGGAVLKKEYEYFKSKGKHIQWHMFNIYRIKGGNKEYPSLLSDKDEKYIEISSF